jgi:hypothetical protein
MANINNHGTKTEAQEAPNFWKWVLGALIAVVLIAFALTAIFYFFRGRKENRPPSGVPQTRLVVNQQVKA